MKDVAKAGVEDGNFHLCDVAMLLRDAWDAVHRETIAKWMG